MKFSKDWHLMLIVLVFIMTDIIILVIANSVQASRFVPTQREDREFPQSVNVCNSLLLMNLILRTL